MRGDHVEDAVEFELDGPVRQRLHRPDRAGPVHVGEVRIARGPLRARVRRVRATAHGGAGSAYGGAWPGSPCAPGRRRWWASSTRRTGAASRPVHRLWTSVPSSAPTTGWTRPTATACGRSSPPSSGGAHRPRRRRRLASLRRHPRLLRDALPTDAPRRPLRDRGLGGAPAREPRCSPHARPGTAGETERLAARIAERIESGAGAETPLSRLAIEFMLVQTSEPSLIDDLAVNRYWIAVRRGQGAAGTGFRLRTTTSTCSTWCGRRGRGPGPAAGGRATLESLRPGRVVTGGAPMMLTIPSRLRGGAITDHTGVEGVQSPRVRGAGCR